MATRRLSESQKRQLVESYREGAASSKLAEIYSCSVNTVTRTLKILLPQDEYEALKASRSRGAGKTKQLSGNEEKTKFQREKVSVQFEQSQEKLELDLVDPRPKSLALDDAEDFAKAIETETDDYIEVSQETKFQQEEVFEEIVPLNDFTLFDEQQEIASKPLDDEILPISAYMLVDKVIELDARPLKDFPELGVLPDQELDQKALCLFSTPRSAKRQCGRNQRVIKIPDTSVIRLSVPYLLSRGITRLVMEGSLISLDS